MIVEIVSFHNTGIQYAPVRPSLHTMIKDFMKSRTELGQPVRSCRLWLHRNPTKFRRCFHTANICIWKFQNMFAVYVLIVLSCSCHFESEKEAATLPKKLVVRSSQTNTTIV